VGIGLSAAGDEIGLDCGAHLAITGACWDLQSGQPKASMAASRQNVPVAYRISIEKSFAFKKTKDGDWRCGTEALRPVEDGFVLNGQ
jgi:hypothetical protein